MAIRLKWGGTTWQGPIADGNLRVKWGGNSWQTAAYCRVKTGSSGSAPPYGGQWTDTGYRGYPNPPSAPWVHHWSYGDIQVAWNYAAGGGASIAYYHIVMTDVNGNWIAQENSTDNISPLWGVGQDSRYQFYVRSVANNGLASGWLGPLRVGIGHPSTPNYGWVERSRGWESYREGGARNMDDPFWIGLPGRVYLSGMHWRNLHTPMSSVVCPGTNRQVHWVVFSQDYGPITNNLGTVYSGNSTDWAFGNWENGNWGIVARGQGWSTTGNGYYMLWCDEMWLSGTEYYDNWEIVSWNPEQGNYYW